MTTTRREFLAGGAAAAGAFGMPGLPAGTGDRAFVAIQVEGGWDYLSMLIPADHWAYQQARPNLRIPRWATLPVTSGFDWFWHPSLAAFRALFDRGDLAIIQNIGYPTPDLSHFESIKKWHSGDPTVGSFRSGWLGRYLSQAYLGGSPLPALDVEGYPSPVFAGHRVPAMIDVRSMAFHFDWNSPEDSAMGRLAIEANTAVAELVAQGLARDIGVRANQGIRFAGALQQIGAGYSPRVAYPATELAERLKVAARYISAGAPIQVYHTKTSGFDTHSLQADRGAPQSGQLAQLLLNVAESVRAFLDDMAAWGRGSDVVVYLYSEFGRRVSENGALGTDHGHGGVGFLAGQPVNGGLYGQTPDLAALHRPNESYYIPHDGNTTDFRSVYATVLERWLQVNSAPILGGTFPILGAL